MNHKFFYRQYLPINTYFITLMKVRAEPNWLDYIVSIQIKWHKTKIILFKFDYNIYGDSVLMLK